MYRFITVSKFMCMLWLSKIYDHVVLQIRTDTTSPEISRIGTWYILFCSKYISMLIPTREVQNSRKLLLKNKDNTLNLNFIFYDTFIKCLNIYINGKTKTWENG